VHNKIDLWQETYGHDYIPPEHAIGVSAVTGEGCDDLLKRIDGALSDHLLKSYHFRVPYKEGRAIA
jgi:50S ribosomal subunit-associated GTPase HflX